jgi:hypothetical protein
MATSLLPDLIPAKNRKPGDSNNALKIQFGSGAEQNTGESLNSE